MNYDHDEIMKEKKNNLKRIKMTFCKRNNKKREKKKEITRELQHKETWSKKAFVDNACPFG
jgi:hypothetical protein